jgi:single-stranded-DNA-specific exonuclease
MNRISSSQEGTAKYTVRRRRSESLLEHLCLVRGFSPDDLQPSYDLHIHSPELLPDIGRARDLIRQAFDQKWHVTVFGDYDADGTPASALLGHLFRRVGISHDIVLPTRQSGYGLRLGQVEEIAARSQLLVTVDTGTSSLAEIARAKELGLKVIVLDHHLPGKTLPAAEAVVNPYRQDSRYPFSGLCGCALAYKLVCALQGKLPGVDESFCKWQLDLVAISTVADMAPIIGENRALVHYGLIVLRQNRRPGLRALLKAAGVESEAVTAMTLGYIIGPRLNASGRLGDNSPALKLLLAEEEVTAAALAAELEAANKQRQDLVDETLLQARSLLLKQNDLGDKLFVLAGQQWPSGVVGLVAGRLTNEYRRPVIVGSIQDGEVRGSARSIERYPLIDGLTKHAGLLLTYGGHAQAAGLSCATDNWDKFAALLKQHAADFISTDDLRPTYLAEAVLTGGELTSRTATEIERLEPYGMGNKQPLLMLREATIRQARLVGTDNRHLKLHLDVAGQGRGSIEAIGFGLAERYKTAVLTEGNFVGYLENNRWNGKDRPQLRLVDFQPSSVEVDFID